jgi:hypothetical protein
MTGRRRRNYLMQLYRYIELNPVIAGMVVTLAALKLPCSAQAVAILVVAMVQILAQRQIPMVTAS